MGGLYSIARQERRGLAGAPHTPPTNTYLRELVQRELLVLRLQLAFTAIAEFIKALPRVSCRCRLPRHELDS